MLGRIGLRHDEIEQCEAVERERSQRDDPEYRVFHFSLPSLRSPW